MPELVTKSCKFAESCPIDYMYKIVVQ